jgi:arginine:ornithine antiporter/lysine permease
MTSPAPRTQDGAAGPAVSPGTVTIGVGGLTAMVVGSMVGAGVFSLPARFAAGTGVWGALVAWAVAGAGMLMLAFVFQRLAIRAPHLDAGVYAYAKAGFGEYAGFFSAFGYWASACVGNTFYWILIMSTLGAAVPALGAGDTWLAVGISSVCAWGFFLLVRRGVQEATGLNRVVTVAKLVPIVVFVLLALFALDVDVLMANLQGGVDGGTLVDQVRGTMIVTVFVFLGVEGASVYSRHARRREDVGRATVLGFLTVLAVFASVTVVSYGVLPSAEIAALRQPSMAGVLEAAVGPWGAVLVSVGLVVSVLGAYLAWSLMAAEVLYVAAQDRDMPRFLARKNARDVPATALLLSTCTVQVMLLLTKVAEDALDLALDLTAALSLLPFLLAAGYALRLATDRAAGVRPRDALVAGLAVLYTTFLLVAAGWELLLIAFLVYAPSTVLFVMTRREQHRRVFSPTEALLFALSLAGAVAAVVALARGAISL